jgi:hypothetical protein
MHPHRPLGGGADRGRRRREARQPAVRLFRNQSGTLGDLLTARGSPNAAYWLYTWYAAMAGNMVVTTPPAQTGIDGFAAVPSAKNQVSVVAGNCSGSCAVTVNGLNSLSLGSTVSVKVEQTVSQGRDRRAGQPLWTPGPVPTMVGQLARVTWTGAARFVVVPSPSCPAQL